MGVIIRVSITEKQIELLRLTNFKSDQIVYDESHNFTFSLENTGDLPQIPQGEIIVYNSRGVEIAAVKINEENLVLNPGEKKKILQNRYHLPIVLVKIRHIYQYPTDKITQQTFTT
jgi:hypothetical protein